MKATQKLHDLGQSLWLDNITRDLLTSGTLKRYIDDLSVTGLTSNPTIFDHAIKASSAYDAAIRNKLSQGKSGESLFSSWPSKTSRAPPTSSGRFSSEPQVSMAGSRSRFRRFLPTTRRRRSPKRRTCMHAQLVPTC